VGGLDFGLAAAGYDADAGDGAAVVLGPGDMAAEAGVADLAIEQNLFDAALLLVQRRADRIEGLGVRVREDEFQPQSVVRL